MRKLTMLLASVLLIGPAALAQSTQPAGRTGLVSDERYLRHDTGNGHPERGARLTAIIDGLDKAGLLKQLVPIAPRPAGLEYVQAVHTKEYIARLRSAFADGKRRLTLDTPISERSYEVALLAAGGAMAAVDAVIDGRVRNAYCLIRPPGHHATASRGMGFCLLNNAAIAARYAQRKHKLARVLIVDWDVHHGNGTQAIFEDDPTVFYFSVHQWPLYPGTGRADETGTGKAAGTKLNVPLPAGSGDAQFLATFRDKLVPAADKFKPDLVLISCGFDAHANDLIGGMKVTSEGYANLTRIVCSIADMHARGRLVSLLEGGYNLDNLASASVAHIRALMEEPTTRSDELTD